MNILLLETIAPEAHDLLEASATLLMAETPSSGPKLARANDIHAIVTRGKGDVSAELIDLCPNLRVIARCGVGLDNVDVKHATKRGVQVINTPGSNADTVAEHTLNLMLSLQRQTFAAATAVKAGNWAFRTSFGGDEIRGKTLGIMGFGNIGQRVKNLALAFGMQVLHMAHPQVPAKLDGKDARQLPDLLAECDIISVHLPLRATTRQLLNAEALAHLRPGASIINTARAEIINETALLSGLQSGAIGGYASDVLGLDGEARAALLALPNVLVTPHAASLTANTYREICLISVRNTMAVLNGQAIERQYLFNGAALG